MPDAGGPIEARLEFDAAMLDEPDGGADSGRVDSGVRPRLDGGFDGGPPGFDAGVGRCEGSATSCSIVPDSLCSSQLGCRLDGECRGFATSCYSIFTSYSCYGQDGCVWNSSTRRCSGLVRSCSGYYGRVSCGGQDGCSWDDSCAGSARPCILLSEAECGRQRGCYWL